jgi:hypothetical protein
MRLLNTSTLKVHEFHNEQAISPYAILSHTWGEEECTLHQMDQPDVKFKTGYLKIELCCRQAVQDGFEWAWVDTLVTYKQLFEA